MLESISYNIAKWALPRENIPFHFKIDENIIFDHIIVHLPYDFELVEVINSDDYYILDNNIIIRSVKISKHVPGIFFGMVIRYNRIPVNLKFSSIINIEFIKNEEAILSQDLECRIFRPSLTITKVPDIIELKDEIESNKIGLDLKFIGFGDITIKIEALIGGKIVSQGDSLLYEVLLRLMERFHEFEKNHEKKSDALKINPQFVRAVIERLQKLIYEDQFPPEILSDDDLKRIQDYFFDIKKQENFSEIIFEETNNILLSILSDTLERNPENNIQLKDIRTNIKTKINAPISNIHLKIKYKDLLENEYPLQERQIQVDDRLTSHKNTSIDIPIRINNIDNQHFLNVTDINMGG